MKNILNGKVLIAMMAIAALLLCGSLAYILVMRPTANSSPDLAAATLCPDHHPRPNLHTAAPAPHADADPAHARANFHPAPGQVAIGVYVQPSTGGVGLRVHTQPSLSADFFSAFDSEVFLVDQGAGTGGWLYLVVSDRFLRCDPGRLGRAGLSHRHSISISMTMEAIFR